MQNQRKLNGNCFRLVIIFVLVMMLLSLNAFANGGGIIPPPPDSSGNNNCIIIDTSYVEQDAPETEFSSIESIAYQLFLLFIL